MNQLKTRASSAALCTTALLLFACGSSETPSLNPALTDAIAQEYGSGPRSSGNTTGSGSNNDSSAGIDPDSRDGDEDPPDMMMPEPDEGEDEPADEPMMEPEPDPPANVPDCDGFAIVQENCGQGGCHGGASNLGNFAESEEAARGYIGRNGALTCASAGPIIDPENPADSVLVLKLSDDPPCGNYMPPSAAFLPASDVECITNWIANLE